MHNNVLYLANSESYYTVGIKKELHTIGRNIDCYFFEDILNVPGYFQIHPFIKRKLAPKRFYDLKSKKIQSFIDYIKSNKYDLIFLNSVVSMPYYFFEKLKQIFTNVPIISYNWSSIRKYNFLPYQDCFTKIFSFDPVDCKENDFEYLPLFYPREFESIGIGQRKRYDISFVGSSFSPGRLEFFNQLAKSGKLDSLNIFFYFFGSSRLEHIKALIKYKRLNKYLYRNWLSTNEVYNVYSQSRSMIDFPMAIQSGLTIRTFETLAAGLELYTTNPEVKNEPFYIPDRIHLIDSEATNFMFKETRDIDKDWQAGFTNYRIDNWVKKIFSNF